MGVYIKKLQAKKVELIFAMLGLHIEDGDIIEVTEPHGRLIDADTLIDRLDVDEYGMKIPKAVIGLTKVLLEDFPTVIEAEGE